jgi:multisubunit Na+/H+ antiporter MnhG subunit
MAVSTFVRLAWVAVLALPDVWTRAGAAGVRSKPI